VVGAGEPDYRKLAAGVEVRVSGPAGDGDNRVEVEEGQTEYDGETGRGKNRRRGSSTRSAKTNVIKLT